MFKVIFNLTIGYIVYLYLLKPLISGIFEANNDAPHRSKPSDTASNKKNNSEYTEYEEVD